MSGTITNPYAIKKKPVQSASLDVALAPANARLVVASSFSQAFDPIKDTKYYQKNTHPSIHSDTQKITEDAGIQHHPGDGAVLLRQSHVLYYAWRNRDNPLMDFIRNVPTAMDKDLIPDFLLGQTSCALYVTLKKHMQDPKYILERIAKLGNMYKLRVLLILVNVDDNAIILRKLNHLAVVNNLTLLLA